MKKIAFETIGCRLNQYDTEKIAAQLAKHGFRRVPFNEPADLYMINTCTVTGRADASCRNIISRAARQENHPPVVVVGCYVDSDPDKVTSLSGVDLVIHNREKDQVVNILRSKFPSLFGDYHNIEQIENINDFHGHNRAWIKIGDGCNQKCSYCIIPTVRGPLTNLPAQKIVDEINALAENGYHEVVLTGIHIGMYQHEEINSISGLVNFILKESNIPRIRLSSIEPQEVDDELIRAINDGGKRVCRHLHIPMQSGSDRILKLMHRPYDAKRYIEIARNIDESIEGVILGADIIVGFPGETDEDFYESVNVADCGHLDYLHVFSYSDRPGTEASVMESKVKPDIIKERNKILRDISNKHHTRRLNAEIGHSAYVISEFKHRKTNLFRGITDNYLRTIIPEGLGGGKEIIKLKITGISGDCLTSKPLV